MSVIESIVQEITIVIVFFSLYLLFLENRNNYQRGNQRSNNRQQRNNFYRRPNFNNGVTESQGTSEL